MTNGCLRVIVVEESTVSDSQEMGVRKPGLSVTSRLRTASDTLFGSFVGKQVPNLEVLISVLRVAVIAKMRVVV